MYPETVPRIASERSELREDSVTSSSTLGDRSIRSINDAADVGYAGAVLGCTKMREPLILEKEVQQFSQVVISFSITLVFQSQKGQQ